MTGCIIVYIPFVLYEISQPIIQKRHHRNIFRLLTSSFYLSSMKNIHPSLTLQTFAFFSVPFLELYSFLLKLCSTIPCKKSLKSILQFLFSPFVIILYFLSATPPFQVNFYKFLGSNGLFFRCFSNSNQIDIL